MYVYIFLSGIPLKVHTEYLTFIQKDTILHNVEIIKSSKINELVCVFQTAAPWSHLHERKWKWKQTHWSTIFVGKAVQSFLYFLSPFWIVICMAAVINVYLKVNSESFFIFPVNAKIVLQ